MVTGNVLRVVTLLCVLLGALVPLAMGGYLVRKARRSKDWPRVSATITASRVLDHGKTRAPYLVFDYRAQGQRREGRRLAVGPRMSTSGNWADRVVARYPVGAAVQAAVDPADPAYAVLEPGVKAGHWLPVAIGVLILAGGLFAVVALP